MKDLTQGSVPGLLAAMAAPIAAGMVFQTLYFLVDLYFVSGLGDAAIAGVGAAGVIPFVVLALTQVLGVGTVAPVAHAVGARDPAAANLVFNQSVLLSGLCGVLTLLAGYVLSSSYMHGVAADSNVAAAGTTYLYWYAPGLALQFAQVAMVSALRGTGLVQPGVIVQMLTVLLNMILAPVLIAGWGTHLPLGVAGAGLASTLAILCGNVFLAVYFARREHYVCLQPRQWRPHADTLRRILCIGLPAGGELFMMVIVMVAIYWTIRHFGPAAQAGFGIAYRVMQTFFLPVLAIAFAAAPLAAQSFGARQPGRVRQCFHVSVLYSSVCMLVVMLACQWYAPLLVRLFSTEPAVIESGAVYLEIGAWNAIASGIIFCCSSIFQAVGNTLPSLLASASRLLTFVLPAILLVSLQPGFQLRHLWYLSVTSVLLQLLVSVILLQRELRLRLTPLERPQPAIPPVAPALDQTS